MTTYTTVADVNGDFSVSFASNYTSGEKITITAERDSAQKSIELYAPADVVGGGIIQFTGTFDNFPNNIGNIILKNELAGVIPANAFRSDPSTNRNFFSKAKGLIIEGAVTQIGSSAFANWLDSVSLEIQSSVLTSVQSLAFSNWTSAKSITLNNQIQSIGDYAFSNWVAFDGYLSLPSGLQTIGSNAFNEWSLAKGVHFNSAPLTIPANAFYGWSSALALTLPTGITQIGNSAFIAWGKATSLVLPDTLQSVGNSAFWGWNKLLTLTIPSSVNSLDAGAFENMSSCNELICMKVTPPSAVASTFAGLKSTCVVKVPSASLSAYQTAPGWSVHASKMIGV